MEMASNYYTQQFARYCEHTKKRQNLILTLGKQDVVGSDLKKHVIVQAQCPDAATCGHAEDCPVMKMAQGSYTYTK